LLQLLAVVELVDIRRVVTVLAVDARDNILPAIGGPDGQGVEAEPRVGKAAKL